jgi:hypothetical protein
MTDQAKANSQLTDEELAWKFISDEFQRKYHEPEECLSRLNSGYEEPRMGCPSRN